MIRLIFVLLCTLIVSCNSSTPKATEDKLPNILFLFADDYTFDAIQALGNDVIETPNLDRLVRNGTQFSQTFNMGGWNGAVCIASRSMIITGKTIWKAKALTDRWAKKENMESAGKSWGKLMENKGYQTYMSGKWHVSIDPKKFFKRLETFVRACLVISSKKKIKKDMIAQKREKSIFGVQPTP